MDRTLERLSSPDDRPGLSVGDTADIVMVDGETITSAVMDRGPDRTVIHNGRVVADKFVVLPRPAV
jgi:cytosine/adenosine deaminase-related metal-dependent hydrolase